MSSLNRVQLIGNLGADPEKRSMPSGGDVVNMRVATSESWKDKLTGEQKERTEWHTVVLFGPWLVEKAVAELRKGSQVFIEGALRTRKWKDKYGHDMYSTEVVASNLRTIASSTKQPEAKAEPAKAPATMEDPNDDIPF